MAAETARQFEALERQAQGLMSVFVEAGYEAVAPAIIQPADVFLDMIGEDLRARTYVFADPDGAEHCLRPDLTVPTCRLHLARHDNPATVARYCYNGPTFRYQPGGPTSVHPNEFRQAGIELFAEPDRERAEVEVLALILTALRGAGLTDFELRLGDLGLFHALLDSLDLHERGRRRLKAQFWQPEAFRAALQRLKQPGPGSLSGLPAELVASLDPADPARARALVAAHMDSHAIELVGTRTIDEIAGGLIAAQEDAKAEPIPDTSAAMIEAYLRVTGPAPEALGEIEGMTRGLSADMDQALDRFQRRLDMMADAGIAPAAAEFSAEFGRNLAYYTGFVFEVVSPKLGRTSPIGGGGRYDGLLSAVGAAKDVSAVGSAIHTERLLGVVAGRRK